MFVFLLYKKILNVVLVLVFNESFA